MESSELGLLGGLCLINKLFNLMHLFPRLCCKLCLHYKNQGRKFNHIYVVCKGWPHWRVWMGVIFRLLQSQTLSTVFVTAGFGWFFFSFEQFLTIPAAALLICNYCTLSSAWFSSVGLKEVLQTTPMSSGHVCIIPNNFLSLCFLKHLVADPPAYLGNLFKSFPFLTAFFSLRLT